VPIVVKINQFTECRLSSPNYLFVDVKLLLSMVPHHGKPTGSHLINSLLLGEPPLLTRIFYSTFSIHRHIRISGDYGMLKSCTVHCTIKIGQENIAPTKCRRNTPEVGI
jgi:hypothetical protein